MTAVTPAAKPAAVAPTQFALGIGLTNECNLACAFCYRDPERVDRLSLDQVRSVMERMPVRSVNLGTGENGLHPEFKPMLDYLRAQPIKLTMTSNGYSVAAVSDEDLPAFKDLEFSLDYPTKEETLQCIEVTGASGDEIRLRFEGDGFLRHMVRNLAGTLLEIGAARRPASWAAEVLAAHDRARAGPTAPAHGLILERVFY